MALDRSSSALRTKRDPRSPTFKSDRPSPLPRSGSQSIRRSSMPGSDAHEADGHAAPSRLLEGQVILVTGGARGLGHEVCKAVAESGATAVIGDVREDLACEGVERITDEGGRADYMKLDVTREADVDASMHAIAERYGRLDALINNAGINVTCSIEELSVADWDRILAVNLRAPFILSRAAFPLMEKQGRGTIINVVSTAAKRAWANAAAYHASKWGLLGLSHAIHVEGRSRNIKVTALVAGGMNTPFLLEPFPDIDVTTLQDPANVARTIVYLLNQPDGTVIPEMMVLPMKETSWP